MSNKPTRDQAMAAVTTLLEWIGEDPNREGLAQTPRRVVDAYLEHCRGYQQDPIACLGTTFQEVDSYDEIVLLRGVRFESLCEHHLAPIIGRVDVGYLPSKRVVGISKMARVVEVFAKRLQVQERLTSQISKAIATALKPRGVAVVVEAVHHCMTTRGVHKPNVSMITSSMTGVFRDNSDSRREFLSLVGRSPTSLPNVSF